MRIWTVLNLTKNINKSIFTKGIVKSELRALRAYRVVSPFNQFINNEKSWIIERNFTTTSSLLKVKSKGKSKKANVNINELGQYIDVEDLTSNLSKSIEKLKADYVKHLSLRSTVGSIEQINVTFDGQEYILQELVDIARQPKTVILKADAFPQAIPDILHAISKSGLNLNPQQDGTTIFIPIPKVTKEHREQLSKNAKALYIKCRDNLKRIRTKQIDDIGKLTSISTDDIHRQQNQVQALTEQYLSEAEAILEAKQKELLGDSD